MVELRECIPPVRSFGCFGNLLPDCRNGRCLASAHDILCCPGLSRSSLAAADAEGFCECANPLRRLVGRGCRSRGGRCEREFSIDSCRAAKSCGGHSCMEPRHWVAVCRRSLADALHHGFLRGDQRFSLFGLQRHNRPPTRLRAPCRQGWLQCDAARIALGRIDHSHFANWLGLAELSAAHLCREESCPCDFFGHGKSRQSRIRAAGVDGHSAWHPVVGGFCGHHT